MDNAFFRLKIGSVKTVKFLCAVLILSGSLPKLAPIMPQTLWAQDETVEPLKLRVNKTTLNVFLPVEHMALPCFMPIEIRSNYNSYVNDSSLFGNRWSFNYSSRVRIDGGKIFVIEGDGLESPYTKERTLEEAKRNEIEKMMVAQKKEDIKAGGLKSDASYREFKTRLESEASFREEQGRKLLPAAVRPGPGLYYSFSRSPSTLEIKANGSFVRRFSNGSLETYNADGFITQTADRHGNKIDFAYIGKQLVKINDSCGRSLSFSYKADKALDGLVDTIRDSLNRSVKYEYKSDRNLKSFKSVRNELFEFDYDSKGFMTRYSRTLPSGKRESISIAYSPKYEIQKETHSDGSEIAYQRTFVANNPSHSVSDIMTKQAGKLTSREVIESKTKEFEIVTRYNAAGQEMSKETRKFSPVTGYPESKLNRNGEGELTTYDASSGQVTRRELIPQGTTLSYTYDSTCGQVSSIKTSQGGRMVSEASFKADRLCNLVSASEVADGKKRIDLSIEWGKQGRITFLRDSISKREIAFTYWKYGKPDSITLKDTGALVVKYSPLGDIENVDTRAHGEGKKRYAKMETLAANGMILAEVKSALNDMLGFIRPAGVNVGL